jgi:hypothetical protein
VIATVNTVSTQAYVAGSTALTAAGTAIANGASAAYNGIINTAQAAQAATFRAAVWVDTLRSGGGGVKAASDFVQGMTSRSRVPGNNAGAAGFATSQVLKLFGINTRP